MGCFFSAPKLVVAEGVIDNIETPTQRTERRTKNAKAIISELRQSWSVGKKTGILCCATEFHDEEMIKTNMAMLGIHVLLQQRRLRDSDPNFNPFPEFEVCFTMVKASDLATLPDPFHLVHKPTPNIFTV